MSGLFGIGGGVVIVPALILILGFTQMQASATSVATIVFSASAGAISFAVDGSVDWRAAAGLAIGSVVGAWVGARSIHRVPTVWLMRAFVVVLLVAAARLAF